MSSEPIRDVSCQLIVEAATVDFTNRNQKATFAVVPAHPFLAEEQLHRRSPGYSLQINQPDGKQYMFAHTMQELHPPRLLSFRHDYPSEDDGFMTDIALLKFQSNPQVGVAKTGVVEISDYKDIAHLIYRPVVVRGLGGRAILPPQIFQTLASEQHRHYRDGLHLAFIITSTNSEGKLCELSHGDSGCIVYLKGDQGESTAVGLCTGKLPFPRGVRPPYQAVVQSHAFRQIEIDYPQLVSNIKVIGTCERSKVLVEGEGRESSDEDPVAAVERSEGELEGMQKQIADLTTKMSHLQELFFQHDKSVEDTLAQQEEIRVLSRKLNELTAQKNADPMIINWLTDELEESKEREKKKDKEIAELQQQIEKINKDLKELKALQLAQGEEIQGKVDKPPPGLRGGLVKMQQHITSLSDTLTQSKVDGGLRPAAIYTGDGEAADREHQSGGDIDRHGSLEVKCTKPEPEPDHLEEDERSAAGKSEDHPPTVDECEIDEAIACSVQGISSATDKRNPSDLSEVEDSAQVELDYSVFEELEERLGRLCIEHDVEDFLIHQNPVDFTDVVIVGVNASKIPKDKFAKVNTEKEQWADFKIFAEEPDDDEDEIELLANSKIRGTTLAKLNGTCEMLVTASVRSPENNNEIAEFAVGPAHMMFSDETNRQLRNGEGLAEARDFVKLNPPHTKYEVHFGIGEGQVAVIDTHHPPFIGYRYKGPEQNISISRGPHPAGYLNETYVPSEDDREVDCKFCLNDIVLLRLDSEEAKRFHGGLSWHGGRKVQLVSIDFSSDLLKYTRPERSVTIPIEVKRKKGFLVKNSLSAAQLRKRREPYHLRFKLYRGEKLEEGDSGSVVFEVINNQELRPLGMLTGRVRKFRQRFGEIYQAVILSRAFKDISTECAPDVEHIRPYNCVEEPIEPLAPQPDVH